MALFGATVAIILFVTVWAALDVWLGLSLAHTVIVIGVIVFAIVMIWSFIAMTGPHTWIGKRRRKRQDLKRFDRAVARDFKAFNHHH